MPATPKPASSTPRVDRREPELVGGQHRDEEADAGDARVGRERGGAEQADAAREDRRAGAGGAPSARGRASAGGSSARPRRDHGLGEEREPPVDRAERAAAQRRERDRRRLHRRERADRAADLARRHLVRQPGEQQRRQERVGRALQRAHDEERAEVGHERGRHRQQRVDDVARAHDAPAPEPLAERPRDQLQQRRTARGRRGSTAPRRRSWRRTRRAAAAPAPRPRRRRTARGSRRCRREGCRARRTVSAYPGTPCSGARSRPHDGAEVDARPSLAAAPQAVQDGRRIARHRPTAPCSTSAATTSASSA